MVVRKRSFINSDRPSCAVTAIFKRGGQTMKKIGICCLGLLFSLCSYAQVQREYHLISAEKIENKAYYFNVSSI
jgi:hypothetical protein